MYYIYNFVPRWAGFLFFSIQLRTYYRQKRDKELVSLLLLPPMFSFVGEFCKLFIHCNSRHVPNKV